MPLLWILQPFHHFTYVTTHSPTFRCFPYVTVHLQPFFCFSNVTCSSLNSPGEPPMNKGPKYQTFSCIYDILNSFADNQSALWNYHILYVLKYTTKVINLLSRGTRVRNTFFEKTLKFRPHIVYIYIYIYIYICVCVCVCVCLCVCLSVCVSVCLGRHHWKTAEPIAMKLGM